MDFLYYLCARINFIISMIRFRLIVLIMVLVPLMAVAQDITATLPVPAQKSGNLFHMASESAKGKPVLLQPFYWVKTLIDSSAVATIDRNYIEQPKKPWAVEVRSSISHSVLKMETDWSHEDILEGHFTAKTDNDFPLSLGLWVGYRGYGFGYSKQLSGEGSTFSLGAMGGSFGINMRINNYRSPTPYVTYSFDTGEEYDAAEGRASMDDPIRIRSFFLDGYYMFNSKHFSYSAAYDQSLIQRRSAGSLMAGLMYDHTSVAFDDNSSYPLIIMMKGLGKLKFTQVNLGAGYAYNWVPARGWLVSAQVMPMVTFYNKSKVYYYDIQDENAYSILWDDEDDVDWDSQFYVVPVGDDDTGNRVTWNFDARLSLVYNWSNCYLRVYGHYNRFRYECDDGLGWLMDWTGYASLGIRF